MLFAFNRLPFLSLLYSYKLTNDKRRVRSSDFNLFQALFHFMRVSCFNFTQRRKRTALKDENEWKKNANVFNTFKSFLEWRDWINLKNSHRSLEFNNVYTRMRKRNETSHPATSASETNNQASQKSQTQWALTWCAYEKSSRKVCRSPWNNFSYLDILIGSTVMFNYQTIKYGQPTSIMR